MAASFGTTTAMQRLPPSQDPEPTSPPLNTLARPATSAMATNAQSQAAAIDIPAAGHRSGRTPALSEDYAARNGNDASVSASESVPTLSTVTPSATTIPVPLPAAPNSSSPLANRRGAALSLGTSPAAKEADGVRAVPPVAASSGSPSVNASIDPLSQHIFRRTNTDMSKNSKLRNHSSRPDSPVPDGGLQTTSDGLTKFPPLPPEVGKERRKGFLGRLSMIAPRKKDGFSDMASDFGEQRTEGSDAQVFSSIVGSGGFIPHHKEPPRYIRVKAHNKKLREFDRMFLAQELIGTRPGEADPDSKTPLVTVSTATQGRKKAMTGGAIWATEFSKDGKYLAAGGCDHVVRVWAVIATQDHRKAQEEEEAENGGLTERLSAPVFMEKPVREFEGHTGEILDLSWSKNNFLLSTSMDKTVRLWHISRQECLCTFKHKEFVSKVAFHPKDDRFFLAGCLDATLRLWSIPDKSIAYSSQLPEMITAVAFSPDGKTAIAGLLNGYCHFFDTERLKPQTQIHVRSSRGRNAKGSKITGIATMVPPNSRDGDARVLITSTDSRLRVYSLRDKTVEEKFKGHEHTSIQLAASYSDDGKYVICGSEDRKAFIWSTGTMDSITKDKQPCECFDAHSDMVTTAIFAPTATRQLLGASGDPIYDLCNPPPVTLMSVQESLVSQSVASDATMHQDGVAQPVPPTPLPKSRPEESPAYIARSTHYDGNIIVTSDDTGVIKVFRQDCAASKRKHESWETGSNFSRKLTASSALVGRSGSIITRTSASSAAHSRRGSLSQPMLSAGFGGVSTTPQLGNSDRILSWRQGIESNSRPGSLVGAASSRSERSISPTKTARAPIGAVGSLASEARKLPYTTTASSPLSPHFAQSRAFPGNGRPGPAVATTRNTAPLPNTSANVNAGSAVSDVAKDNSTMPQPSIETNAVSRDPEGGGKGSIGIPNGSDNEQPTLRPPSPSVKKSAEEDTPQSDPSGTSYSFWNLNKWKGITGLRVSLTGNSNAGVGGHTPRPAGDQAKVGESSSSIPAHNHEKGQTSQRRSLGSLSAAILPKAAGSKSDMGADDGTDAAVALAGSASETGKAGPGEKHSRKKSVASGILAHLTPSIMANSGDDSSDHNNYLYPPGHERSAYTRGSSVVSRLSSELTSSDGDGDGEGIEMRCSKCGGREFKARRINGAQQLHCSRCGKAVDERAEK